MFTSWSFITGQIIARGDVNVSAVKWHIDCSFCIVYPFIHPANMRQLDFYVYVNFIYLVVCLFDRDSAQLLSCTSFSYKLIYICSPMAWHNIFLRRINTVIKEPTKNCYKTYSLNKKHTPVRFHNTKMPQQKQPGLLRLSVCISSHD